MCCDKGEESSRGQGHREPDGATERVYSWNRKGRNSREFWDAGEEILIWLSEPRPSQMFERWYPIWVRLLLVQYHLRTSFISIISIKTLLNPRLDFTWEKSLIWPHFALTLTQHTNSMSSKYSQLRSQIQFLVVFNVTPIQKMMKVEKHIHASFLETIYPK